MSIDDVLTAIIEFVYQALDKNSKARAAALDISKEIERLLRDGY